MLIGPEILSKVSATQRKVRNTCRFLIGNLSDFTPATTTTAAGTTTGGTGNEVPYEELRSVDRYMLHQVMDVRGVTVIPESH